MYPAMVLTMRPTCISRSVGRARHYCTTGWHARSRTGTCWWHQQALVAKYRLPWVPTYLFTESYPERPLTWHMPVLSLRFCLPRQLSPFANFSCSSVIQLSPSPMPPLSSESPTQPPLQPPRLCSVLAKSCTVYPRSPKARPQRRSMC